jgi:hypothetical protein
VATECQPLGYNQQRGVQMSKVIINYLQVIYDLSNVTHVRLDIPIVHPKHDIDMDKNQTMML